MKAIIVGLGGRARSWIEVCHRNAEVEIVGYIEPVPEQCQRVADQYNIQSDQLFDSISAALDSVSPDFAIDVTPPKVHEPAAIEIFAAGGFT